MPLRKKIVYIKENEAPANCKGFNFFGIVRLKILLRIGASIASPSHPKDEDLS